MVFLQFCLHFLQLLGGQLPFAHPSLNFIIMSQPKVLLFGAGSIGTIYIYILQKAGCEVTAVCRSNYEAAKGKSQFQKFSLT